MSQKIPSDSAQKGFAVGRGLLAAAETLNYSMSEQRSDSLHGTSSRQLNSLGSGMGGGGEGQERDSQLSRRGGSHISNTMKLFASLGLSPTDLDALAQIPEDNISVETLPHLIMQLKNRKVESDRRMAGNPRDLSSLSPETSYRATREDWEDMRVGRLGSSMGQTSARTQQGDFGYSSMQDVPVRGYEFDYGHNNGSGGRDRQYSELSRDPYSGHGMGPSPSDSIFMQRRMGSPSQGKVQDFLGVMPHMFPHVCSLCDFDVHSTMEWTQHINGLRHAENRRLLLQMYPDWDPHVASNRSSGSLLLETTNRSAGLLGPVPMATGQQTGGMSSSWGGGAGSGLSNKSQPHSAPPNKIRSRVVVAKYERKPLSNKSLFALAQPFGTLCEHLVLKNKAFLEMETHKEALDMVHYYQQKPAVLYGKEITFYLSKELLVIEKDDRSERTDREVKGNGSQVVFFSNMPRETEKKMELLTIARRFGTVDKHLFLNDEAFVQLGTPEDAEMLVKYYTVNPLTIRGRSIRLNICTKYKTLNVNRQRGGQVQGRPDDRVRKQSSSTGTKTSSKSTKSASTSTKSKEDKKEESKPAEDDVAVVEESGEEVAGVMEGDDDAEDYGIDKGTHDADAPEDKAEEAAEEESTDAPLESKEEESAPELGDISEEKAPSNDADITEHPDGEGAKKGAVSEEQVETEAENAPAETEATPEETEAKDDVVPAESSELTEEDLAEGQEGSMEQDFPENMDDFVTLDELAEDEDFDRQDSQSKHSDSGSGSSKKSGGLRVVNVVGFKRGYGFVNEILSLAKPFGKVVQNLVLDVRPEAFLQLSSEEEAKAMVNFYSGNVQATVCGKAVKIYHSQTYATIQSGRVVYVGQIPHCKYSDAALLKISEPFGKVRRYFLNRSRNECFIEMERGEEAERMAETYKENPPKFQGKRLTVYVSRKYKQLKYGHRPPPPEAEEKRPSKRERVEGEGNSNSSGPPAKPAVKQDEEPPLKKAREEKATESETDEKAQEKEPIETPKEQSVVVVKEVVQQTTDQPPDISDVKTMDTDVEVKHEEVETTISTRVKNEEVQTAISQPQAEIKPSSSPTSLGPYDSNKPVGVEYVKMGYYCRVCFLFYSNEEAAKKVHCSSQSHYEKLKKHLEKEKAKAQSTTGKKSL